MWQLFKVARLASKVEKIAAARDFSQRIEPLPRGRCGDIARHVNALLAQAEERDRELRVKLDELTDARDDAQTMNQMLRRLKNEIKSRSAERDAALSRAEAANEAKSQFLSNMSHEIRTPMHGILGIADVLSRTNLEARQQGLVQTITRCGNGLLSIINDVLDFSKIESGRFDLVPRPFSLRVAIEDIVGVLTARYEKKGIELVVRVDAQLPDLLVGDAGRIKQVLTNLLENGLKFTEQGYVLLDVGGTMKGDALDLSIVVQDTGIGIPADKLSAVFEKFNQVDNSSTRRHEGTGIGLAICRMLLTRMDGQIEVASSVGKGSTFSVTMKLPVHENVQPSLSSRMMDVVAKAPVAIEAPVADRNVVALRGTDFQRPRVLLVEDNAVNQEVAKEYLGQMGCVVTIASNGREGVHRYKAQPFDIVFMDWLMPEMDGLGATRLIREFEREQSRSRTPIIALTANAFAQGRETCMVAGMDAVVSKPFTVEDLEGALKQWLPAQQAAAPVAAADCA